MTATFYVDGPDEVAVGETAVYLLGLDIGEDQLGAIAVTVVLDPTFFADVSAQPLAFGAADNTRDFHADGARFALAGATLETIGGRVDLLEITARLTAPPGRGVPLTVETRGAVSQTGAPIPVQSGSLYQFAAHGPIEIRERTLRPVYLTQPCQAAFLATGGVGGRTWSLVDGAPPSGLTLSPHGVLSGTPSETGNFAFQLQVSDGGTPQSSDVRWFSWTVRPAPLRIETMSLPAVAPGEVYSADLTHSGGLAPVAWTAEGLPPGLAVDGDRVGGTLDLEHDEFGPVSIALEARDADDPAQVVRRTVTLLVAPIAPSAVVAAPDAHILAVGRDLYMTRYRVQADSLVVQGSAGGVDKAAIADAKNAILQQLFLGGGFGGSAGGSPVEGGAGGGYPVQGGPVRDDAAFWGAMDDMYGAPYGPDSDQPDPGGPGGGEPGAGPGGGLGGGGLPTHEEANHVWQLLQLYSELDEMEKGGRHYNVELEVRIDDIRVLTYSFGLGGEMTEPGPAAGLYGAYPPPSRFEAVMFYLTGGRTMAYARRRLEDLLFRERHSENAAKTIRGASQPGRAIPQRPQAGRAQPDRTAAAAVLSSRLDRQTERTRWFGRSGMATAVAVSGAAAVASGLVAGAAVVAGAAGATVAATRAARRRVDREIARIADIADHVAKDRNSRRNQAGGSDPIEVVLTPGAHRLSVSWSGQLVSGTSYGAAQMIGDFLNYTVEIAPVNAEGWPRFEGAPVEEKGGGNVPGGTQEHPVVLTGSAVDLLVGYDAERQPELIAARGTADYAAPALFPEPWPDYAMVAPPRLDRLEVVGVDEYGRNSIVATGARSVLLWANRVGGFRGRTVAVETEAHTATAVAAADADADGWSDLFVAFGREIVEIAGIRPEPIDNQLMTPLTTSLHASGAEAVTPAGVVELRATKLLRPPVLVSPSDPPPAPAGDDLVGVLSYERTVRRYVSAGGAAMAQTEALASIDGDAVMAQPRSVLLSASDGPARLFVALWQRHEIAQWMRTSTLTWTPEPPMSLPYRPQRLVDAAPLLPGVLVVGADRLGLWRNPGDPGDKIILIAGGSGPIIVAAAADSLAVLERAKAHILVYG